MRRYHVTTFGCQMNAHDSERIKGLLEELGLGEAPSPEDADVLVFNTCTIREKPDTRLAAHLGNARVLKDRDPERVIAVGGCYAEAQRERIFELYPFVDVAFGPGSIPHLAEWLGAGGEGVPRGAFGTGEERAFAGRLPRHQERRFQAWVQISMGCNSVCSYCIVPAVRGREVSRRPGEVLAEVEALCARRRPRGDAARAERELVRPRRRQRFRRAPARRGRRGRNRPHPLHEPSSEGLPRPGDRRDGRLQRGLRARAPSAPVRLDARAEGHAPHLLARALPPRRGRAARAIPDLALTTDLIVGFPGETEAEFQETLSAVEEIGYDGAFTFVYSPRAGTEAASLPDQIPDEVKRDRIERLVDVVQRVAEDRNRERIGRVEEVLVEGRSRTDPSLLRGRTRRNTTVNFSGSAAPGELARVEIQDATSTTLRGVELAAVAA